MITKEQVLQAQSNRGEGVVKIGALKDNRVKCEEFANEFLDKAYAFKPTKPEVLSYFMAGEDLACKEDLIFNLGQK